MCPLQTSVLQSLSWERACPPETGHEDTAPPEALAGQPPRRSNRFATTLRNEIQQLQARLQKSRSTATLASSTEEEGEAEDDMGIFPSQGWNLRLFTSPALRGRFFTTSTAWEAHELIDGFWRPRGSLECNPEIPAFPGEEY